VTLSPPRFSDRTRRSLACTQIPPEPNKRQSCVFSIHRRWRFSSNSSCRISIRATEVAGSYVDSSGVTHGFIYDDGTFTTLNVPGAYDTSVDAINDRGEVAGSYLDDTGEHGFLGTPEGGEANAGGFGFGELLSANAHHGGVNDLLPGVPGIRGGSPHAANGPGMMDQTAAVGTRFASFGGPASDQTATQALLHGNGASLGAG
jgi:uncharacterized membrane protein